MTARYSRLTALQRDALVAVRTSGTLGGAATATRRSLERRGLIVRVAGGWRARSLDERAEAVAERSRPADAGAEPKGGSS